MAKLPPVNLSTTLNVFRTRFNRLVDSVGDIATLTTDANTTVVQAINTIDSNLGTRTSLTTNDTTTFVASINELDADIGDISTLTTSSTTDVVSAINSLFTDKLDSAHTQSIIDSNFNDSNVIEAIPNKVFSNSKLINNTITVNGVEIALGAAGSIDITDSGTSVALIRSTLSADSDTGIHYDSASATFSLNKIPNSALGSATLTVNGVTGNIGGEINIEAVDSAKVDGMLDSAFADQKRDIVSRQAEFSITTNAGKMVFNTASEIVEFNEDTGTDTHISIGTPAGTGNTAAGRPTNSGVIEANKHLLMISDSAEIIASKIELITTPDATGNDIDILSGGGVNIDLAYPYGGVLTVKENNSTKYEFNPSDTLGPAFIMNGNGTVRANPSGTGTSGSLLLEAEKDLVFTSNKFNTYNPNNYGRFTFSNSNNSNAIRIDTRYDSNSIRSDEPLSIMTTETGESISFKSASGTYHLYDSINQNYNTFTVDSGELSLNVNAKQDYITYMQDGGKWKSVLGDSGASFQYLSGTDRTELTFRSLNPDTPASDWIIETSAGDGSVPDLEIKSNNITLNHQSGQDIRLEENNSLYGKIEVSSGGPKLAATGATDPVELETVSGEIILDANGENGITLDAGSGKIYFKDNGSNTAYFNTTNSNTQLWIYSSASETHVLNSTWDGDDLTVQGDITTLSDERTKENITTITDGLETVSKLRGVRYNKIGEEEAKVGVIAQEIEQVLPEVVLTKEDGMKSVDYGKIVGVLIEAIKDLKNEVDDLKNKLGD